MKQRIKLYVLVSIVGGLIIAYFMGLKNYVSFAYLKQMSLFLHQYVDSHYPFMVLMYVLAYTVLVMTVMPGVLMLTLLGGFLFGVLLGTLYSVIGAVCGSLLFFFIIRYALHEYVNKKQSPRIERMKVHVQQDGARYLLTLQFLTIVPYFVINTVAALGNVPLFTFVWTTIVGAIPLLFVYAFAGRQLGTITSIRGVLSGKMLLLFILLALIASLPLIIKRIKQETINW